MRVLKSSPTLEQAQRRLERLKAIQPPLQSTDGISLLVILKYQFTN